MKKSTPRKIRELRTRVEDEAVAEFAMAPGWRDRLARRLILVLGNPDIPPSHLSSLMSEPLPDTFEHLAARVAGSTEWLDRGEAAPFWDGSESRMMLACTNVFPLYVAKGVRKYKMTLDVLEGEAAGSVLGMAVPGWYVSRLAGWVTGREHVRPFPYDLAGMDFTAYVKHTSRGMPEVVELACTGGEETANRRLLTARKKGCIKHEGDCDYCPVGRSGCSLAYHSRDLPVGRCVNQGKYGCTVPYVTPEGLCPDCVILERLPVLRTKTDGEVG